MRDVYINYLKLVRRLSSNTLIAYQKDLNLFNNFIEDRNWDEDSMDIRKARAFIGFLSQKNMGSRSINRVLSCVRGYYRFKQKNGYSGRNPFKEVRSLKTETRLPSFLFEKEMESLLDQQNEDIWSARNLLILELLYSTGCRVSELVSINVTEVEFKSRSIRITGKGGKERLVFIGEKAYDVLKNYLIRRKAFITRKGFSGDDAARALFLNTRCKRLGVRGVQYILKNILMESDIAKPVSPHTFRHSFATHILNHGGDIRKVQELLGHASLSTTQVYTHLDIDRLKRVYREAHPHARGDL